MIGAKIYALQGNLSELFKEWRSLNFDSIFVSLSVYSNLEFRNLARKFNITSFVILPIFFNPEELKNNPELFSITDKGAKAIDEWVRFVCPTREEYKTKIIENTTNIVTELNPDGLSLDFIAILYIGKKSTLRDA
jgi:hypothetical protein